MLVLVFYSGGFIRTSTIDLPHFLINPNPYIYLSNNYCVLDLETTNKNFGDPREQENRLLLTVVKEADKQFLHSWANEYELGDILDYLKQFDFLVGHNIKYDLKWLKRAGLDLHDVLVYDTMIGEYVYYGNTRPKGGLGLGPTSVRYGGPPKQPYVDSLISGGVCPSTIDTEALLSRCILDVSQTEDIFLKQRKILHNANLLPVQFTRCIFTPVLADMESKGLALDAEAVEAEFKKADEEYRRISDELDQFTGGINPKSPKQVAEFLYDTLEFQELSDRSGPRRTPAGARLTSSDALEQLVAKTPKQAKFLELKKKQSLLSASLDKALSKFKECCDNKDYLYAQFNQTITQTHRLSSSGTEYKVQFQNLHRRFKPLFKTKQEDWYVGEIDGSQLEFRVAAFLGQDARARDDIAEGVDVHSFTAKIISEAGQPTDRQEAKAHTFKPLFGGESGTKAEKEYYKAFKAKYSGIADTQNAWREQVLRTKELVTITGLRFFWPDTKITPTGYITNTSSIFNYPIQSFATADIIPIAVTYLWHRMRDMKSYLVNTIHDSAIAEISPDEVELFRDISVKAFTYDTYEYLEKVYKIVMNIPLGAGLKIGKRWSEADKELMLRLYDQVKEDGRYTIDKAEIKYTGEIDANWCS